MALGVSCIYSQDEDKGGIIFIRNDFQKALKQAESKNQLLFVDVYTQWCGPCMLMDKNVFSLPEVGDFYNRSFVCLKMDAENGEGPAFKKNFNVKVYPTYLFIDPVTTSVVHRSTSRQEADQFIATGKDALNPALRSTVLEEQFKKGARDREFLVKYITYLEKMSDRETLSEVMDIYMGLPGTDLTDTMAWHLFDKYIHGTDTPEFKEFLSNREKYGKALGVKTVDEKIKREYTSELLNYMRGSVYTDDRYSEDRYNQIINSFNMIDFPGKKTAIAESEIYNLLRTRDYEKADEYIWKFIGDTVNYTGDDKISLMWSLMQFSRYGLDNPEYKRYALNYVRYIAYNYPDRDNASIHYTYAKMLEETILSFKNKDRLVNDKFTATPEYGKEVYDMRDPNLKPKPQK